MRKKPLRKTLIIGNWSNRRTELDFLSRKVKSHLVSVMNRTEPRTRLFVHLPAIAPDANLCIGSINLFRHFWVDFHDIITNKLKFEANCPEVRQELKLFALVSTLADSEHAAIKMLIVPRILLIVFSRDQKIYASSCLELFIKIEEKFKKNTRHTQIVWFRGENIREKRENWEDFKQMISKM